MNYNELAKLMMEAGWYQYRQTKGSHRIWAHPDRPNRVPIPFHGSREINPKLVEAIKKQAGLE